MRDAVTMSGWAGFSEEDLRRMQQKDQAGPTAAARGRRPAAGSRSRQQLQREKALQASAQRCSAAGAPELHPGQQLDKPPPAAEAPAAAPSAPQQKPGKEKHKPVSEEAERPAGIKELERPEVELREKSRLELLQQEQKLMEESNKRKKALLAKTIAEKSKQTQAEALRLRKIQKDLQALDDSVSHDISILRGRIEQASWDYTAARKRYNKAEAEYVSAKLELHKKTEVKEQLTEHLCAIIQQNELRKALKLEELMVQLQATEEEVQRLREEQEREEKEKEEEEARKRSSCVETSQRDNQDETNNDCKAKEKETEEKKEEEEVQEVEEKKEVEEERKKEVEGGKKDVQKEEEEVTSS